MKNYVCKLYSFNDLKDSSQELLENVSSYTEVIVRKTINPYVVREVITNIEIPITILERVDDILIDCNCSAFVSKNDFRDLDDIRDPMVMINYIKSHSDFEMWTNELNFTLGNELEEASLSRK